MVPVYVELDDEFARHLGLELGEIDLLFARELRSDLVDHAVAGLATAAGLTMCLAMVCYLGLPKGRDALRDLVRLSAVMFQRRVRV